MNAQLNAIRYGFLRGWIELKHTFHSVQDLWGYLFPAVLLLVVTFFMHLLWDKRFNTLVFLSSIFFMVLFLSIAMTDRREYQHLIEAREAAQAAQK